jgi:hypothetical protein
VLESLLVTASTAPPLSSTVTTSTLASTAEPPSDALASELPQAHPSCPHWHPVTTGQQNPYAHGLPPQSAWGNPVAPP